jgi:hypothetical protein
MYTNTIRNIKIIKIEAQAQAESAIVRSLSPSNVRDRLIQDAEGQVTKDQGYSRKINESSTMSDSSSIHVLSSESIFGSKPIADFPPGVTVMFADLLASLLGVLLETPFKHLPYSKLSTIPLIGL